MSSEAIAEGLSAPDLPNVEGLQQEDEVRRKGRGQWFPRLVAWYLRRRYASPPATTALDQRPVPDRAQAAIRRACVLSAMSGATAGTVSTAAAIFTAETEGLATWVTVPTAAVTIGGEMVFRAWVHLSLTCDLADIFGVPIRADDAGDLWRLYALAFKTEQHATDDEDDPGQALVERVVHVEGEEVGEKIGRQLLGESVVRNIIPLAGIATSSVSNWRLTRHVGDTVRRYMRYHRAIEDALTAAEGACRACYDLLVEGCWHLFIADGRLNPEETALLANLLRKMPPVERAAVQRRFTDEEHDWSERIRDVPEAMRDPFLRALTVAAAVDKAVSLPERKILRRAARKLDRPYDQAAVDAMIREFGAVGVVEHG